MGGPKRSVKAGSLLALDLMEEEETDDVLSLEEDDPLDGG